MCTKICSYCENAKKNRGDGGLIGGKGGQGGCVLQRIEVIVKKQEKFKKKKVGAGSGGGGSSV